MSWSGGERLCLLSLYRAADTQQRAHGRTRALHRVSSGYRLWQNVDDATRRTYVLFTPSIPLLADSLLHFLFAFLSVAPSSPSVSSVRLSGGAVPGGRGIGIVDVQQEESRDEYRARAREGGDTLGLSAMHQALANDTMTDEISIARLGDDVPTKSRARAPLRAGSVKKALSSSTRAKRRSTSPPMTASATGVFVDHMIELPADDDEEESVGGKRPTSANDRQRARASLVGSRPTPHNVSSLSSVGPSGTAREVAAIVLDSGGSSRDGNEQDKEKGGSGVKDTGKRRARPVQEAEEDEVSPQPVLKPKSRLVQRRSDVQTAQTETDARTSKPPRRRAKGMTIGSDSDSYSDAGEGKGSKGSVPPRRAAGAGSTTPVKSGMKPRPRSKSKSRPRSVLGWESGDEVRVVAETGTGTGKQREEVAKSTPNGEVVTKKGEKGKSKEGRKETEKVTSRPRSPTRSPFPTSFDTKNSRTPNRRLSVSVFVPPVPRDYFSSQNVGHAIEAEGEGGRERESEKEGADTSATPAPILKQLAPAASACAVAAEASTSTSKRGKPTPTKISTAVGASGKSRPQPKAKAKPKPGASKEMTKTRVDDNDEDMNKGEEDNDTSVIINRPVTSTSRGGPRRSAANKATARLREEIMPDVVSFEREQKQAKRRRSMGWESVASLGGENEETAEKGGKRRKVVTEVEEEEEEAEVEDVVLAPSIKTKSKPINGKGKAKGTMTVCSDEDMDDPPVKNKPSGPQEKKGAHGRGKELAAIRLMTTSVSLSDDVIKVSLLFPLKYRREMLTPNVPMAQRLTKLGVQMTMKPMDCTHLVAKGIVRTEKFLCAMSVSPYVLTEEWANASAKGGKLLRAFQSSI